MDRKFAIPAGIAALAVLAIAGLLAIFTLSANPAHAAVSDYKVEYPPANSKGQVKVSFVTDSNTTDATPIVITLAEDTVIGANVADAHVTVADTNETSTAEKSGTATIDATARKVTVSYTMASLPADTKTTVTVAIGTASPTSDQETQVTSLAGNMPFAIMVKVGTDAEMTVRGKVGLGTVWDTVPNKPAKTDKIQLHIPVGSQAERVASNALGDGSWIHVVLHEDFDVPSTISPNLIEIQARNVADDNLSSELLDFKNPSAVIVDDSDIYDAGNKDDIISLRIADYDGNPEDNTRTGVGEVSGTDLVVVVISKAAGITAPTEGGKTYKIAYSVDPDTDVDKTDSANNADDGLRSKIDLYLPLLVTLDKNKVARGETVQATAKGFETGTVDFWRDADANGVVDDGEARLCSAQLSGNVGSCSFTVDYPDFQPGMGDYMMATRNLINAKAVNVTADIQNYDGTLEEDDVILLKQSITASPSTANPGSTITVQLQDFPTSAGTALGWVQLDAEDVTASGFTLAKGQGRFEITIPDDTPTGTRKLEVQIGSGDTKAKADVEIEIGGAMLSTTTGMMVVPKQEVLLTGSGYTKSSYIKSIKLGADDVFPSGKTAFHSGGTNAQTRANSHIQTDASGNWNATVEIPLTTGTANAKGSVRSLRATDQNDRAGVVSLTFQDRTVDMSPMEGHPGTTITLTGSGYPGDDKVDVDIFYNKVDIETVEPDSLGNWTHTFKVPSENEDGSAIGVPSDNVVKVQFTTKETVLTDRTTVIDSFAHRVPPASITLEPAAAVEGSMVKVTGGGFTRYAPVNHVKVGNVYGTIRPSTASTDRNGAVEFEFMVPGRDPGVETVTVKIGADPQGVGGIEVGAALEILDPSGVVGAVTMPVAEALKPLLDAGMLDRIFYFNNDTKTWTWYFTNPDLASTNNLEEIVSGAPVWIMVTESTTVMLNNRSVSLTCVGEDCWNLINFP